MALGTIIEYRLRLLGLPFYWRTLISEWEPAVRFVDEQVAGPYARWVHTHEFRDHQRGTIVTDAVRYRLPLFPLGELVSPLVRLQLRRIFDFRSRKLREIFTRSP